MVAQRDNLRRLPVLLLLAALLAVPLLRPVAPAFAQPADLFGVQEFLDRQPGVLSDFRVGDRSVAALLEYYGLLNGVHPRLMLALLEATNGLLSNPRPTAEQLARPLSPAGPAGFVAQIEWGYREIVAGIQPYTQPPTVTFSDGSQRTIALNQSREGVAIQRFLSNGRSVDEWLRSVRAFNQAFERYFDNQLPAMSAPLGSGRSTIQLSAPWPRGTRVNHLAYFDHEYPLVDSGGDGNSRMVDYLGRSNVQYNSHDGHDFTFPDGVFSTPVLAAAGGTAYARVDPIGRGLGVVILHPGGFETVYWHLGSFDAIFDGKIDTNVGVTVAAGTRIGSSGGSGIGPYGTPHLHFEVRRRDSSGLRQIDPFGWYGSTPDPCAAHPRCQTLGWLWSAASSGVPPLVPPIDTTPPTVTAALEPDAGLVLQVGFDGHVLQTVGSGQPLSAGDLQFSAGRFGQALQLSSGEVRYLINDTAAAAAGTLAVWVQVPSGVPIQSEQVIVASSRQPWDAPNAQSLFLQRDTSSGRRQWAFVTVGPGGETHRLAVDDTLAAGWHLLTISWRGSDGLKRLAINGNIVATATAVTLPTQLSDEWWLGRRGSGGTAANLVIDELTLTRDVSGAPRISQLFSAPAYIAQTPIVTKTDVLVDVNAYDLGGAIAAVQLGVNGAFSARQPYAESFRVSLPAREGTVTVTVRVFDLSNNVSEVSRTIGYDQAPRGYFGYRSNGSSSTRVQVTGYDLHLPMQMQVSQYADFRDAGWQAFQSSFTLNRPMPAQLYLRLRDANGNIGPPLLVTAQQDRLLLPVP